MEKNHTNLAKKEVGIALFTSGKADSRTRNIIRDKSGHYMVIKGQFSEKM